MDSIDGRPKSMADRQGRNPPTSAENSDRRESTGPHYLTLMSSYMGRLGLILGDAVPVGLKQSQDICFGHRINLEGHGFTYQSPCLVGRC